MTDRPANEPTYEMIKAAASALYEDDWGMEHPDVTAERALRRALAVAPWVARSPNSQLPTPEMVKAGIEELSFYHPSEDDGETAEEIVKEIFASMLRCWHK